MAFIFTEPNAYLSDLRDKLEKETNTYYNNNLKTAFNDTITLMQGWNNPPAPPNFIDRFRNPQEIFALDQSTLYHANISERRNKIKSPSIEDRKVTFAMQKDFQKKELIKIKQKYENAKQMITTGPIDEDRKTIALNKLREDYDKLVNNTKEHHEKQNKIMAELLHLAYLTNLKNEYKKRYGKEAPKINKREDMTSLFEQSVKIGVKGNSWLYGTIEVSGNSVSFDISSQACRQEAIQAAMMNFYASNPEADLTKPIKLTLTLPEPSSESMRQSQSYYINQMLLECAEKGIDLSVKVGQTTYAPDQQAVIKKQAKLSAWETNQKESIASALEERKEDIENRRTISLGKNKN